MNHNGKAIFAHPRDLNIGPSACQSLAFLAKEQWDEQGRDVDTKLYMGTDHVFPAPKYRDAIEETIRDNGIELKTDYQLKAVRHKEKEADFLWRHENGGSLQTETVNFDFLYYTPKLVPVPALAGSKLLDVNGFVGPLNGGSMRHNTYKNVFAIGDCNGLEVMKSTGYPNPNPNPNWR